MRKFILTPIFTSVVFILLQIFVQLDDFILSLDYLDLGEPGIEILFFSVIYSIIFGIILSFFDDGVKKIKKALVFYSISTLSLGLFYIATFFILLMCCFEGWYI